MADDAFSNLPAAVQMHSQPGVSAADIAQALTDYEGNIAAVGRELGISRNRLVERINTHPELVLLLADLRQEAIDAAESNHFKRAKSGADPQAERFLLQTIGRDRGYSTSVAGMGANGDIVITVRRFGEGQIEQD